MSRVAFVTGASSGLGRALSLRLADDGWAVALAARRVDALEEVRGRVQSAGGRAAVCPCDVTDDEAVRAAVARAEAELGPLDLLVANAGVNAPMSARALDASVLEDLVRVNVMGAARPVAAVLPGMLRRGRGHLVAVGSLAGYGGLPHAAAYSASKGALHNFFESLRLDLRGTGVDVTIATPGHVRTPMVAHIPPAELPMMLEADVAAALLARGIRRRARLVSFPAPMAAAAWWGQILPRWLYDPIAATFAPARGAHR